MGQMIDSYRQEVAKVVQVCEVGQRLASDVVSGVGRSQVGPTVIRLGVHTQCDVVHSHIALSRMSKHICQQPILDIVGNLRNLIVASAAQCRVISVAM